MITQSIFDSNMYHYIDPEYKNFYNNVIVEFL